MRRGWLLGLAFALTSAGAQPAAARALLDGPHGGSARSGSPPATHRDPFAALKSPSVRTAPGQLRPNILLILTDDQDLRLDSMDVMPNVKRLITEQGTTVDNYYIADSLCCPSRSTILRSQYVHNHKVFTNSPPTGGYEQFFPLGHENSNVGTWMQAAGYTTAFMGKYLNGYPLPTDRTHVPAGWSEWISPAGGNPYFSYNYLLNENGQLKAYGKQPEDHITDVLAGKADDFLHRHAGQEAPFFMYLAPYAPHKPADPAPRHADLFPDAKVPRVPSYNEADVSDKPKAIQDRVRLGPLKMQEMDTSYRHRLQSLQAVDEMVARLVATLEATGELTRTYVVFTSDNGYHMGHHRLLDGKMTAYEEDIRVPLIVRGPGVPAGGTLSGYLTGNVDLAPSLADLAGAELPDFVDGRSLVPLFSEAPPAPSAWRQAYLVEQYPFSTEPEEGQPSPLTTLRRRFDLTGVLEPPDGMDVEAGAAAGRRMKARQSLTTPAEGDPAAIYIALRTLRYTYVEYDTGERELYDNPADPYQLQNLAATADPALLAGLSTWVGQLHTCQAAGCREVEQAVPVGLTPAPGTTPSPATTPQPTASTLPPTPSRSPTSEATPVPTGTVPPLHPALFLPIACGSAGCPK